ncbi:MAG: Bax inhibitor-1 family protein [Enterococcus sp.]
MNNQIETPILKTQGLNQFYAKVYSFFAIGLGLSALTAFLGATVYQEQTLNFINGFPLGFVGLWLVEIILVIVLSRKAESNPALSVAGFIVYSLLNGVTLSVTFLMYDLGTVYTALAVASVTFIVSAVFGVFTKRDLSAVGRICINLLIGIIVASLVNVFLLRSAPVDLFISFVTVFVFVGLTAKDNQMIRRFYAKYSEENTGIAAFIALQLYLDFINLFLAILRIIGRND